jgi:WD40 repeat protein
MKLACTPVSLGAHPCLPHLAAGLVTGGVTVVNCTTSSVSQTIPFQGSMRAVAYGLNDMSASCPLFAGSDDGKLYHILTDSTSTASMHRVVPGAIPISRISSLGGGLVAAGDDEGGIHLFDFRESSEAPATSLLEQADYISSIQIFKETSLAVASGDGTLAIYDLRMPPKAKIKLVAATPSYEDDLLSLTMFGAGLAVGGTLAGAVQV